MRYYEFLSTGSKSVIGIARKIEAMDQFTPIGKREIDWLFGVSKNEEFMGSLFWHSQRINHRSPMHADDSLLTDAATCANAYIVLNKINDRYSRTASKIQRNSAI